MNVAVFPFHPSKHTSHPKRDSDTARAHPSLPPHTETNSRDLVACPFLFFFFFFATISIVEVLEVALRARLCFVKSPLTPLLL